MKIRGNLWHIARVGCVCIGVAGCSSGALEEGVAEQHEELRPRRVCAGANDLPCSKGQFCDAARPGQCPSATQSGVCATRPSACTYQYDPVCGCDGVTYPNACSAAAVGVPVASRGECAAEAAFCGGFAGIPCPEGQSCIDDPSDDCDPQAGGADCGGICVQETNPCAAVLCPVGTQCVVDGGEARCEPVEGCGDTVCGAGLVCCNPLLGICTPPGGVCIF